MTTAIPPWGERQKKIETVMREGELWARCSCIRTASPAGAA